MAEENIKTEIEESVFPEESRLVIEGILEKYGLKKIQEEGLKKFFKAGATEGKGRILSDLPGAKICQLLREYKEGKLKLEKISGVLEKNLNIPPEQAKEITEELRKKILVSLKPIKKEGVLKSPPEEKPPKPGKPDIYRESIE